MLVTEFAMPRTVVCQAALSMEFSKQEYWRGLPFPSPGVLSNPGIEPESLLHCRQILYHLSHQGSLLEGEGILSTIVLFSGLRTSLEAMDQEKIHIYQFFI